MTKTHQDNQNSDDQAFITAGLIDVDKSLPPTSKEEYDYYMQLPDKKVGNLQ